MADVIENKNKFPLFKTVFGSFSIFFDNFKSSIIIGSVFSVVYILVNIISGQSLFCYSNDYSKQFFCSNNFFVFVISNLFLWFVACVYMRNWYHVVILKTQKFSIKNILPKKNDVKIFGVLFLFFISICIATGSSFLLFIREPNPDWKIEIIYFAVVSIGFFVPMFAVPLLSLISFAAEGVKIPKFKELAAVSKGKILGMFLSFIGVVMISFLLMLSGMRYLVQISIDGNFFVVVIAEFLYNIILMFIASIFINYCYMQKKFLFERS